MYKNPRGNSIITIIVTVVAIIVAAPLTLAIGPLLGAGISEAVYVGSVFGAECAAGLICGGSQNTGSSGGGGGTVHANEPCTSAANACGQTNSGFIVNNGNGTGSCNASTPPNAQCPVPVITAGSGFYATPNTITPGQASTLTWSAANTTDCSVAGENGLRQNFNGGSGSVSTGALTQSTTFTLICEDGQGGPQTTLSLRVIIDPHYREI